MNTLNIRKPYKNGIYWFKDINTQEIVYIGKDSNMDTNNRMFHHKKPSQNKYDMDIELNKNKDKYVYEQVAFADDFNIDLIEEVLITWFKPKYNYEYIEGVNLQRKDNLNFIQMLLDKYRITKTDKAKLFKLILLRAND